MSTIAKIDFHQLAAEIAQYLEPVEQLQSVFEDEDQSWQQQLMEVVIDMMTGDEEHLARLLFQYLNGSINVSKLAQSMQQMQGGSMEAWERLDDVLESLDTDAMAEVYERIYVDTTERVAQGIRQQARNMARPRRIELTFRFNLTNPRARKWAEERAADLVRRTNYQMRQDLRRLVAESVSGGMTPMQAARHIRPLVGLLPQHRRAVESFRKAQERLVGAATANRRASAYARRLLAHRGRLIARTEIMAAQNAGQLGLWQHKVAIRQLPSSVQKLWIITRDDRLCPRCATMQGERALAPLDGPWLFPGGRKSAGEVLVMHPPGHPMCRCTHGIFAPEFFTDDQTKAVLFGTEPDSIEVLDKALGATWRRTRSAEA